MVTTSRSGLSTCSCCERQSERTAALAGRAHVDADVVSLWSQLDSVGRTGITHQAWNTSSHFWMNGRLDTKRYIFYPDRRTAVA